MRMKSAIQFDADRLNRSDSYRWRRLRNILRCPHTGSSLDVDGDCLMSKEGRFRYPIHENGVISFIADQHAASSRVQESHYDHFSTQYFENLQFAHTQEYMAYLDEEFSGLIDDTTLGVVAEPCCGTGEVARVFKDRFEVLIGVDVSRRMLSLAAKNGLNDDIFYIHGDATTLPLADNSCDTVVMIGGIHHVPERERLFREVYRVLKPGGNFLFREPVNDFWLWRMIRAVIYRLSPALDAGTERPVRYSDTVPVLEGVGLKVEVWKPIGFLGFCLFMNSDVLVVNRIFRFVPGIRSLVRASTRLDHLIVSRAMFRNMGLIVVGLAKKSTT